MATMYKRRTVRAYNETAVRVVLADDDQIPAGVIFEVAGEQWFSLTCSAGYVREVVPGLRVPAGMFNDPKNPMPGEAITAVPVSKVRFADED